MNKIDELRHLEDNVYLSSAKLNRALSELGRAASEILGYEVVADLCGGDEIEFRSVGEHDAVDDFACIRIEDILNILEKNGME